MNPSDLILLTISLFFLGIILYTFNKLDKDKR